MFEASIGGQWVLFDATRMAPVDRLLRLATGRDAKDVAFCTIFGPISFDAKADHGARVPGPECTASDTARRDR